MKDNTVDFQKIVDRADETLNWLKNNGRGCFEEQKHLDHDSQDRIYWHYGYLIALRDVYCFLTGHPLKLNAGEINAGRADADNSEAKTLAPSAQKDWIPVPESGIPFVLESKPLLIAHLPRKQMWVGFQTTSNEWCGMDGRVLKIRPTHYQELPEMPGGVAGA